jgi:hypothetical protein
LSDRFLCTVFIFAAAILQKYDFYQNRWKSMKIDDNRWKSMKIAESWYGNDPDWELLGN